MIAEVNPDATYWVFDDSFLEPAVKIYFDRLGIKYAFCPTKRNDWKEWDRGKAECPFEKYLNAVKYDSMKFDLIIGNPPYDKSLHLKILKKAMEYCDFENGGEIVWLHPARWMQSITSAEKKYEWIGSHLGIPEVIPSDKVTDVFGICSNDLLISHLKTNGMTYGEVDKFALNTKIAVGKSGVAKSIYEKIQNKMPARLSDVVVNKPFEKYSILTAMLIMAHGSGGDGVQPTFLVNDTHNGIYHNDVFMPDGRRYCDRRGKGGPKKKDGTANDKLFNNHVEFETFELADNFRLSMRTDFMKFLDLLTRMDVHVHPDKIPYMVDYSKPWDDNRYFEYFSLTEEERKLVKDTMAKCKAK